MNKKILLLSMITFSALSFAQIGINTPDPQGSFHIDGGKDNPIASSPNAIQQSNDFVVSKTGNIGIGTIAPSTKIDVLAPATTGDVIGLRLRANNSTASIGQSMIIGFHPNTSVGGDAPWGIGAQFFTAASGQTDSDFIFKSSNGASYLDRMIIKNNGNIGIGTTSPTQILDVNGNTRIRSITTNLGSVTDNVVVADTDGVLKTVSDIPRVSVYTTDLIAPDESQTLTVTASNFTFAQLNIVAYNTCTRTMISTFSKNGNTVNYLGGQARDIVGQWTLLDAEGNYGSVKFPNVIGCYGGNGTQFDFDIKVTGNNVTITNRGNLAKSFSLRVISNL